MKKIFLLCLVLLSLTTSTFARKQEWKDKSFNYKESKVILMEFNYLPNHNPISSNETTDYFYDKIDKISESLFKQNYIIAYPGDVIEAIEKNQGINMKNLFKEDETKYRETISSFIKNTIDIHIKIDVLVYDIGTQYCEGYYINVPTTENTNIFTPYGTIHATTDKQSQQYISGGNFPTSYCAVRFFAYDPKTEKLIWARIDDRAKVNRSAFENTTPKDMFKRIVNDWVGDFRNTFNK